MTYEEIAQSACDAPFRAQQKNTELSQLLRFLDDKSIKNVLEIGVLKGGTIKAWRHILKPKGRITGVDLPGGAYGGGFTDEEGKAIVDMCTEMNVGVGLYTGDSHSDEMVAKIQKVADACGGFDFIFIDGDHTYEGAKKDFNSYKEMLAPGGYIALHDIVVHTYYPEVKVYQLWDEIKKEYPNRFSKEFIDKDFVTDHGMWGGIGLICLGTLK